MTANMQWQHNSPPARYVIPVQSYAPDEFVAAPEMGRGGANDSRASYFSIIPESRPGHFPDLAKFAACDRPNVNLQTIETEEAMGAGLKPGHIIRVQDWSEESRLHNRVMLVIRTNRSDVSMSMTCLSFCRHGPRQRSLDFAREHAPVVDGGSGAPPQAAQQNNMVPLRIVVGAEQSPAAIFQLQPNIWINVREIWNVDYGLRVAVLGDAEERSFEVLLTRVQQIFCSTLGDADRQIQASPRTSNRALPGTVRRGGGQQDRRRQSATQYLQRSGFFGVVQRQVTFPETPMERSRSGQ